MSWKAEAISELMGQLLSVKSDHKARRIDDDEAKKRIATIRKNRESIQAGRQVIIHPLAGYEPTITPGQMRQEGYHRPVGGRHSAGKRVALFAGTNLHG